MKILITSLFLIINGFGFWTTEGKEGKAFEFKDVSKEKQSFENHFHLNKAYTLSGDFSITFWAAPASGIDAKDVILGTASGGNNINFFGAKARLHNGNADVVTATSSAQADVWAHYAFTRSGNSVKVYFNGTEQNQGNWGGDFVFNNIGGNGTSNEQYQGKLDDIRIYSRALTAQEISNLEQTNITEPLVTDVTHHWPLDDMREYFNRDVVSNKFPFTSHWMGITDYQISFTGGSSLRDLDHDGDLDFASGVMRQSDRMNNIMHWWEFDINDPDNWTRHDVGNGHQSVASGEALDMNGDGWIDLALGEHWYENPKNARKTNWTMHKSFGNQSEDINIGDVDGDSIPELLQLWGPGTLYKIGSDPTGPAEVLFRTGPPNKSQGGFIADLDGDGDGDIITGRAVWYRNENGDGKTWTQVPIINQGPNAPMTWAGDIDGDGDVDFAYVAHWGGEAAWVENMDGKGTSWSRHVVGTGKRPFHNITVADFDNDGDLDIYGGENMGNNYIWENTDGKGNFQEHTVSLTARGHTARVGDVDCDGDLDIVGKPWEGGNHVYHRNMLVERGGTPKWQPERGPYEAGHKIQPDCRTRLNVTKKWNLPNLPLDYVWNYKNGVQKNLHLMGAVDGKYSITINTIDGQILNTYEGAEKYPDVLSFKAQGKGPWILKVNTNRGTGIKKLIYR